MQQTDGQGRRGAAIASAAALAMGSANCYPAAMSCDKIRRISAVLMALVLTVGLATRGFGGPDIMVKSAVTAAHDMPMSGDMPGKCNGCAGDEKGVAPATACSAFCIAVFALPSGAVAIDAAPVAILRPAAERHATGLNVPPDPYPPRPTILS